MRDLATATEWWEPYDDLLIATGSTSEHTRIPGSELDGVFGFRTLDDVTALCGRLDGTAARRVLVVGGGYVGIEVAEALIARELDVSMVTSGEQPMASLDPEMGVLVADALRDDAYAAFRPLRARIAAVAGDLQAEMAAIDAHMLGLLAQRPALNEERIGAAHTALIDPAVNSVGQLTERLGISTRSLERIAAAVFGFSPKLLLQRQRFLRSLAQFMLDPSLAWLETLDWQYYDQAHFIRDFRRFMGTTPSAYAREPHPIMLAAAHVRSRTAGKVMQVLHDPADDAAAPDPLR